jgi:hypothetical protein
MKPSGGLIICRRGRFPAFKQSKKVLAAIGAEPNTGMCVTLVAADKLEPVK